MLRHALGIALLGTLTPPIGPSPAPTRLTEGARVGDSVRVVLTLQVQGTRPGMPARRPAPGRETAAPPADEQLPFGFRSEVRWLERVRQVDESGRPTAVARRLEHAEGLVEAFRGPGQTARVTVRDEVGLLIAARRGPEVVVASAGGPLTREELDLLQGACDPLALGAFLPDRPVDVGDRWDLPEAAARAVSEYEAIRSSTLRARLAALDDRAARIELTGEVKGTVRGAEGTVKATGELVLDRVRGRFRRLRLERDEVRTRGHVESALDVRSTLELNLEPIDPPAALDDAILAELPVEPDEARLLLVLGAPGGRARLLHDRGWHVTSGDGPRLILRRVAGQELVARLDLVAGPNAGPGRHQDPEQFRADVEKALGASVGRLIGAGEVDGPPAAGFRYKVGLEGVEQENGDVPIWYYYLAASPGGDQLVAIFTLSRASEAAFADQDERVMATLEWTTR